MIAYLCGVATVWAGIFAWMLSPWTAFAPTRGESIARFGVLVVVIPALASWLTLELVQWFRPARVFDRRLRLSAQRFGLGLLAGAAGVVATALLLPLLGHVVTDGPISGLSAAVATLMCTGFLRGNKAGACVHCGYDLRGITPGTVCPECGRSPIE